MVTIDTIVPTLYKTSQTVNQFRRHKVDNSMRKKEINRERERKSDCNLFGLPSKIKPIFYTQMVIKFVIFTNGLQNNHSNLD